MDKIPWKKRTSMSDVYEVAEYVFKRKLARGGMRYEIWRSGAMDCNTQDFDEFARKAQPILRRNKAR